MDKNRKFIALGVALLAIVIIVVACVCSAKDKGEPEPVYKMDASNSVALNNTEINAAIDKIISGADMTGDACVEFESPVFINLMCDSYEIIDRYYGDHALFVKVKKTTKDSYDYTMLRFQLNDQNKITDCITFNIAG